MYALVVRACLNHTERMVSSSSHGEAFSNLVNYKMIAHNASNLSLFQTVYSYRV